MSKTTKTTKTKTPPAPVTMAAPDTCTEPRRGTEEVLFELRDMIRCCHLAAWVLVNDGDQWGEKPRPPAENGLIALQFQLERASKLLDEFPL